VTSEISESEANFEYIAHSSLFQGEDDFARTQLFRRVKVLLDHARQNFCPSEPCSCAHGGKCLDLHSSTAGQDASDAAGNCIGGRESEGGEGRGEGGAGAVSGKGKGKDILCAICSNSGWKAGDDEAKRQLQVCWCVVWVSL